MPPTTRSTASSCGGEKVDDEGISRAQSLPWNGPHLETPAFWSDFHGRFNTYLCDAITDRLSDDYEARIDERVSVEAPDLEEERQLKPDVVMHDPTGRSGRPAPAGAVGGSRSRSLMWCWSRTGNDL